MIGFSLGPQLDALKPVFSGNLESIFSGKSIISSHYLTCNRATTGYYYNGDGDLIVEVPNKLRIQTDLITGERGALVEGQATDKCSAKSLTPTDIASSGITKSGNALATLTIVTDASVISGAGLSSIVPSGKLYRLDNSAGATNAFANVSGATGNTNTHTLSAYMSVVSNGQTNANCIGYGGVGSTTYPVTLDGPLSRFVVSAAPANSGLNLFFIARPGQVVDFIAFGMTEEDTPSSYVTGDGSPATRVADGVTAQLSTGSYSVVATFIDGTSQTDTINSVDNSLTLPAYPKSVSRLVIT